MYPPKIRDLNWTDRLHVLEVIVRALCPYCEVPFFTDEEIEEAFILQTEGNTTFFIHEECFNAKHKLN